MSRIKITSNPYEKRISYARWDETVATWVDITYANNPNSRLVSTDLTEGFFPFITQEIADVIINEYQDGQGPIELVFQGTEDEYEDLRLICESAEYSEKVRCERGDQYLENARKVLPDIVGKGCPKFSAGRKNAIPGNRRKIHRTCSPFTV